MEPLILPDNYNNSTECEIIHDLFDYRTTDQRLLFPYMALITLILFIIYLLILFIGFTLFIYYHKKYERLLHRKIGLYMFASLGIIFIIISGCVRAVVSQFYYPCGIYHLFGSFAVPFTGLAIPLIIIEHYNNYVFSNAVGKYNLKIVFNEFNDNDEALKQYSTKLNSLTFLKESLSMYRYPFKSTSSSSSVSVNNKGSNKSINNKNNSELTTSIVDDPIINDKQHNNNITSNKSGSFYNTSDLNTNEIKASIINDLRILRLLNFISSTRFRTFLIIIYIVPYLIAYIVILIQNPYIRPQNGCVACPLHDVLSYFAFFYVIIGVGITLIFSSKIKKHKDPFDIILNTKYISYAALIGIIVFGLSLFVNDGTIGNYLSVTHLLYVCLIIMQYFLFLHPVIIAFTYDIPIQDSDIETRSMSSDLSKHSYKKRSKEINEEFKEMLKIPEARQEFSDYLGYEYAIENLRMYEMIEHFKLTFFDSSHQTRRAKCNKIFNLFLENNAVFQVNLPFTITSQIRFILDNPDIELQPEIFNKAEKELINIMLGSYTRFVKQQV